MKANLLRHSGNSAVLAIVPNKPEMNDPKGEMVRPERFELPTYCSGGNRSIHLSYGRVDSVYIPRLQAAILGIIR